MAENNATTSENNEVPETENNGAESAQNLTSPESENASSVDALQVDNTEEKNAVENTQTQVQASKPETVVIKKGGSGLALLAILIALGVGGAGYYFGQQQVQEFQQKLTALESQIGALPAVPKNIAATNPAELEQARAQIAQLADNTQSTVGKLERLEKELSLKDQAINALQTQINRLSSETKAEQPNDWLLSEADFLLNNALRKLVLDNDVDTAVSLLKVSDETLEKVTDPRVVAVRTAINSDLKQLLSVNNVDQNAIMQRLSRLANNLDELTVLNVNFDEPNNGLSDSLDDWKENAEKSATSFLNHFIRITPRDKETKALLAPNQDVYLRENIRLRLQLAIMAVPRQQNELYKQSLETVASWVRSYFDTNTEIAQDFLKEIDDLADQSIYVDTPSQLNSLNVLDKLLNKQPQEVQKIEISVDKAITEEANDTAKEEKAEETPAKADEPPAENAPAEQPSQQQQ
ncbi:uroporphyrinogen-III C-methyltransferase [Caviibacterium pharyngocola]|uniref:HemX protein n=1 Tax=Caviibacterium pharyngocola TaxID=28159 RepID=A0A2M8RWH9_9PAST|nr:uroporphyrinogen-III C-methyltransferase [Caviibacterium pharyngocola]PJG83250.1 HemX protein [Caviibacterium pharyngocola]